MNATNPFASSLPSATAGSDEAVKKQQHYCFPGYEGEPISWVHLGDTSQVGWFTCQLSGQRVGVKVAIGNAAHGRTRLCAEAWARAFAGTGRPLGGGQILGKPALFFEWVAGVTLAEAAPDLISVERTFSDVATTLARLHVAGFRHGDVKADNIVVDASGRAHLIDWSLVAPLGSHVVGGTPTMLPPELFERGEMRAGAEADLFALGKTLSALAVARGCPISPQILAASAHNPADRPSAAQVAAIRRWPLELAYLVARRSRIESALAQGLRLCMPLPPDPAKAGTHVLMDGLLDALSGLSPSTFEVSTSVTLPECSRNERLELLHFLGIRPDAHHFEGTEASFLECLEGEPESNTRALHTDGFTSLFAEIAARPDAETHYATLAQLLRSSGLPEGVTPSTVIALLRRSGHLRLAQELADKSGLVAQSADLLRMLGKLDEAKAQLDTLVGQERNDASAMVIRLMLDRGERTQSSKIVLPDHPNNAEVRALVHHQRGEIELGLQVTTDATLHTLGPEARARLLVVRGMLLQARGDALSAYRTFERGADLAEAVGAQAVEASARANESAAAHDAGALGSALHASDRAIPLLTKMGRQAHAGRVQLTRALTLFGLGAYAEARAQIHQAIAAAQRAGDEQAVRYAIFAQIDALIDTHSPMAGYAQFDSQSQTDPATDGKVRQLEMATLHDQLQGELTKPSWSDVSAEDRQLQQAYLVLSSQPQDLVSKPTEFKHLASGELRVDPAHSEQTRWITARANLRCDLARGVDEILLRDDRAAPPTQIAPVLFEAEQAARTLARPDAAKRLHERRRDVISKLTPHIPPAYRARFFSLKWTQYESGAASLETSSAQIDLLSAIARGLRDRTSLGDLLRRVLDGLVLWLGVERGILLLRAPGDPTRLVARFARGISREDLQGEQLKLSMTIAERALSGEEPMVAVDAAGDSANANTSDLSASVHALRLRSVLAVPLIARGEALGVVYLDDRVRRGAFGPQEIAWVRLLATQAAAAVADARDELRLRRAVRRAERAQRRLEEHLAQAESALDVARAALSNDTVRNANQQRRYPALLGESEPMRKLLRLLDRIVDAPDERLPVLIQGESGSGKELVARALHDQGRRRGPFVAENCGAIPEPLLESTLFGHVRGAFTGADRSRIGLFEIARGGTLLLDEVGEMSAGLQAKLLRVLQEGEVRPVGAEKTVPVDVRVLAASHRDLIGLVRDGRFREDLYYRLAVLTVHVPPLRERIEDISQLVSHFIGKFANTNSREAGGDTSHRLRVTKRALAALLAAPWPGNVRQLENEIRRALVLCDDVLDVEMLSESVQNRPSQEPRTLREQVDALEKRLVVESLDKTQGNQTKAAAELGLSRFGLQKMMKRLEILS